MKAIVYEQYGAPDVLKLAEMEKPAPKNGEVLVKIHAASINYGDTIMVQGKPLIGRLWSGFTKPKHPVIGTDIAGVVEAVGSSVTDLQVGDEVYADISEHGFGAFAEYKCVPAHVLVRKPHNITLEEAAAFPQASIVALQGLRDNGKIGPGQEVLINGASGGVGSFAVQIAKAYGARVTGICGPSHLELVRSLGADKVIDYTQQDFVFAPPHYDLILDIVADKSVADIMEVLTERGNYVAVAFNATSLIMGPWISIGGQKKVSSLVHKPRVEDLVYMKELVEDGRVRPVIDKRFSLEELPEAIQYVINGRHHGKVVININ